MTFQKLMEEEEYIAKKELERKRKIEKERQELLAVEEKAQMKKLHHMCCPKCGMRLVEIDYKGIKIDECSGCRGVWLDSGEMDAVTKLEKPMLAKLFSVFGE